MFSSVQSYIGANILSNAQGRHCRSAVRVWKSVFLWWAHREYVTPRNKLVEASWKACAVGGWGPRPFAFRLYEHLSRKKEKWQHYGTLASGNCEACSFYTNLTHSLTLQSCLTVIHVSFKEMHCRKRILAVQNLLAGAGANNKWNTCAQTSYLAFIHS